MPREPKPSYYASKDAWYTEVGGRRIRLATGRYSKNEAHARFHALMLEVAENPSPDSGPKVVTVTSILDAYLDVACSKNTERVRAEKVRILSAFARSHGSKKVVELKAFHLEKWLPEASDEARKHRESRRKAIADRDGDVHRPDRKPGWGDDYRAKVAATIQAALNWGVRSGLIDRNPVETFTLVGTGRRRPMTASEFRRLWGASRKGKKSGRWSSSGRRLREIFLVAKLTGARSKELRDLLWCNLDLERGVAVLVRHKTSDKTPAPRIIPLSAVVLRLLTVIGARDGVEGTIFKTVHGNPWHRVSLPQKIRRLREKAGVGEGATIYGLRHRFGTRAVKQGVDLATLKELMGHARTASLENYVHLAGDVSHLKEAQDRVHRPRPDRASGA